LRRRLAARLAEGELLLQHAADEALDPDDRLARHVGQDQRLVVAIARRLQGRQDRRRSLVRGRADVAPTMEWLVETLLVNELKARLDDETLLADPIVYTLDEGASPATSAGSSSASPDGAGASARPRPWL
jgi:hypothetical protein